jgi:hypothetical protein
VIEAFYLQIHGAEDLAEHVLLHAAASFIHYPGWALSCGGAFLGNVYALSTKPQLPLPCQEYNDGLI